MFLTTPLQNHHKKKDFSCGKPLLDNYLHTQAKQDIKRKLAVCFVMADINDIVQGYYTLSNSAIERDLLSNEIKNKMPPAYYNLPVTLLGRLAVNSSQKGKGYGKILLANALKRSYNVSITSIGSMPVIVDPIDNEAIAFYQKFGFVLLPHSGKMLLPMETISKLF